MAIWDTTGEDSVSYLTLETRQTKEVDREKNHVQGLWFARQMSHKFKCFR